LDRPRYPAGGLLLARTAGKRRQVSSERGPIGTGWGMAYRRAASQIRVARAALHCPVDTRTSGGRVGAASAWWPGTRTGPRWGARCLAVLEGNGVGRAEHTGECLPVVPRHCRRPVAAHQGRPL